MGLTAPERETVIQMDDSSELAIITTHQRPIIHKLNQNPQAKKLRDLTFEGSKGAEFELPAHMISFRRAELRGKGLGNPENLKRGARQ